MPFVAYLSDMETIEFEQFLKKIKAEELPATTGLSFTANQIDSLKLLFTNRDEYAKNYFHYCILTRAVK